MLLQTSYSSSHSVPIPIAPAFGDGFVHEGFSSFHTRDARLASGRL